MNIHEPLFKLLDSYARTKHRCFVTELFIPINAAEYVVCFRPENVPRNGPTRFNCVYLTIQLKDAEKMVIEKVISEPIASEMDEKLSHLAQQQAM